MSYAVEACPECKHPYAHHTSEGCCHHDIGVICGCLMLPPRRSTSPSAVLDLMEKLRVQTARAERLDKENDERFTRETEYQNRIRALESRVQSLEQRLRDVSSYAVRDLNQK